MFHLSDTERLKSNFDSLRNFLCLINLRIHFLISEKKPTYFWRFLAYYPLPIMDQGKTLPDMNLLNQGGNKKMTKKKKRKITIIDQGETLPDMSLLNQGDSKKMTKKKESKITSVDQGKTLPDLNLLNQGGNKKMAEKKKKRKIISSETHRFELSLEIIKADSKTQYPEFNWLDLVDKKKASEMEVVEQKEVIDPISGDDTDAIAREIDVIKLEESFENTVCSEHL